MFNMIKVLGIVVFALFGLFEFPNEAMAQSDNKEMGKNKDINKKVYARIDAGMMLINDITYSTSGSSSGITVTADIDLTTDAGTSLSGAVGYRINDNIAIEGELGYSAADFDTVEGTATVTSGSSNLSVSQSAALSGQISMLTGMANVVVSPAGKSSQFRPFIGGGAGLAKINTEINSIGTLTVNSDEDYTKIIANGFAGIDYQIDEDVTLGAKYKYLWVESVDTGYDDATAHVFMATLTLNF